MKVNSTEPKQEQKKQKTTEKTSEDSKTKKQQTQTKSSEGNSTEAKPKKPANAQAAAAAPKTYFTANAQGDEKHSYRILDTLISLFEQAIRKAFPEDQTLPVLVVPGKQTDYQCNSAMAIAQVQTKNHANLIY